MILKSLQTYFNNALLGYYPDTEIQSFFNILAETYLGYKRIDITLNAESLINPEKYEAFQKAINRLQNYEPIQYIIGNTEFYGLTFNVNPSVLIPRLETEELVDWIIQNSNTQNPKPKTILDIGTGSGCIAISLAKNLPNASVFALDVSEKALKTAKENAKVNKVDITFINENILKPENWNMELKDLKFDVIVSNPPYVRDSEKQLMKANVLNHEPHLALFVEDDDALLFYKAIVTFCKTNLAENGSLYFEINEALAEPIMHLLKPLFKTVALKQDIFGKDRMIKAVNL